MKQRILLYWEMIHKSLWFLPLVFIFAGAGLSWLSLRAQSLGARNWQSLDWLLHDAGAQHAHNLLSSLLGSMITMTALVITLTMIVLALASQNLGPRLISYFMGSKVTQATHGLFVGTIVYLLLTLRVISEEIPSEEVPHIAVTMGSFLVLLSLVILIVFTHHLARSIVSDTVVHYVGNELHAQMQSYLRHYADKQRRALLSMAESSQFTTQKSGYVQSIDNDVLIEALQEADGYLNLTIRPGDYVFADAVMGELSSKDNKALGKKLREAIVIGGEPTAVQDPEFMISQLVEIALRALSPSLFDPFTAIRVINKLSSILKQSFPLRYGVYGVTDSSDICRLTVPLSTFPRLLDLSFNQIRHAGADMPEVQIHLLRTLQALAAQTDNPAFLQVIHEHANMVMQAAKSRLKEQAAINRIKVEFDGTCNFLDKAAAAK